MNVDDISFLPKGYFHHNAVIRHAHQWIRLDGRPLCKRAADVLPARLFPNFLFIDLLSLP